MEDRPSPRSLTQITLKRGPWWLAVAFVLLTLIALCLVPLFVQQRVNRLRALIEPVDPARTLVTRWQFALVREVASIDELMLTADTSELQNYLFAAELERNASRELDSLARQLGPEVIAAVVRARTLSDRWHELVTETEVRGLTGREHAAASQLPRELELFDKVLIAVSEIDSVLIRISERIFHKIRSAEKAGIVLTFILGGLALIAAAAVIAIEARQRRFAAEAERGRLETAEALAQAERVEEARTRLIRGITHDVKNPLGAALGYVELLTLGVKAPLAPGQTPLVEGVDRSIRNALRIIDDLLEISRAETGSMELHRERVDLNDLASDAANDYTASARTAGHRLNFVPSDEPIILETDSSRIRQVLDNLLTNAIKYTPAPGVITVRVRREQRNGKNPRPWGIIEVSDTGPGIPPELREAVFEEYTRFERARASGHGLGLAISRGIARQLGGDVTIADAMPGATFELALPLTEPVPAAGDNAEAGKS